MTFTFALDKKNNNINPYKILLMYKMKIYSKDDGTEDNSE